MKVRPVVEYNSQLSEASSTTSVVEGYSYLFTPDVTWDKYLESPADAGQALRLSDRIPESLSISIGASSSRMLHSGHNSLF